MSKSTIFSLYQLGTVVRFDDRDNRFEGKIVGIMLETDRTTYKIAWWDGRDRKTEWFEVFEFTVVDARSSSFFPVGFIGNTHNGSG